MLNLSRPLRGSVPVRDPELLARLARALWLREATASVPQWNDHVGLDVAVVTRRNEFGNANALKATTQRRASPNDPALRGNAKGEADGSGGAGGQLHSATKIREKSDYVSQ